jgi:sugar phosphate isomerase/epimerase
MAAALATAGSLAVGRRGDGSFLAADSQNPYAPFKMGLQSYSLRGYTVENKPDVAKALDTTRALGITYWEAYPAHFPVTADAATIAEYKARTGAAGVKVVGYGVNRFSKDHEANRRLFEFARAFGLEYMSANPTPDSFDSLDKLVDEYGVAIGIHNHGPEDRLYQKIDLISAAIKDHHPKIGCCIDTGHFLRSNEDPVRAVEVFGKRIFGVHLKDVKDAKTFTIMGKGDLRTVDLLKGLAKLQYGYCLALEYEEHPEEPSADIRECLAVTRDAVAKAVGG